MRESTIPVEDEENTVDLSEEDLVTMNRELVADLRYAVSLAHQVTGYPIEFFLRPEGFGA